MPGFDYPTFWAELGKTELKSIQGMSGSPILAFGKTRDGEVKYGVVAVQSGWFYERIPRIIYGGDFRSLMHEAELCFDHLVDGLADDKEQVGGR